MRILESKYNWIFLNVDLNSRIKMKEKLISETEHEAVEIF